MKCNKVKSSSKQVSVLCDHFADDVCERSEFAADVKEVENADDKDGDDEAVEDASVGDEAGNETHCEPSEEQRNDDAVNQVPHVRVEETQLLTEFSRLTDKQLQQQQHNER